MRFTRYKKYVPDPAGEMSLEDLVNALADYFLQSGFQNPYLGFYEMQGEHTLEELRQAIEQALMNSDLLDEELRERLSQMQMEGQLDELIENLIERMQQEDYISVDQPHEPAQQSSLAGQTGDRSEERRVGKEGRSGWGARQ